MSFKYSFNLSSQERKRPLPHKLIIGRQELEPLNNVILKVLGFCFFYRERLQIQPNLHNDAIPFVPDLVQLDYEMRPRLWVECGETSLNKLNKLAVKVNEAEIWILKPSFNEAEAMIPAMRRADLRKDRYSIIGFDEVMIQEMTDSLKPRNDLSWVRCDESERLLQLDFNGLWYDSAYSVIRY
jgi:hypothetical protein